MNVNRDDPPNPSALAIAFVRRLRAQVPSGVRLDASAGSIEIATDDFRVSVQIERILETPDELASNLEAAAISFLNTLQDVIARATRLPWPSKE